MSKLISKNFEFIVDELNPVKGQLFEPGSEKPKGFRSPNEAEINCLQGEISGS